MFETAVRNKYRFPFRGQVSVEDLWDLSLTNLDSVFKTLNAQKKQESEESLLSERSAADTELETKIAIVRHIVAVKLAERDAAKSAKEKRERDQRIMEIIAAKQDEALQGKSIEELQAMLGK